MNTIRKKYVGLPLLIVFLFSACIEKNDSRTSKDKNNTEQNSITTKQVNNMDKCIEVVRQNTMIVQSKGNFELFDELFADNYIDHTPQKGGFSADKEGTKSLYKALRQAFPDFHAIIHWQICDGDMVTTYKTYYGTHEGTFLNVEPTHKKIEFIAVDVMRVQNGKITDHWGVGDLISLYKQLGLIPILENQ